MIPMIPSTLVSPEAPQKLSPPLPFFSPFAIRSESTEISVGVCLLTENSLRES